MTAEPSAFDRVLGYGGPRDTPAVLGTELPAGCERQDCAETRYRQADVIDVMRRYIDRIEADLSSANRRLAVIDAREGRTTT